MSNIKIKNTSNFHLHINLPNVRYVRDMTPGQEMSVQEDVYEELVYDAGCRTFIKDGFLKVISSSQEQEVPTAEQKTSDEVNVGELLTSKTVSEFSKIIKDASPALREQIVSEAIRLSIADPARCSLIKHYTGVDVVNAMSLARKE